VNDKNQKIGTWKCERSGVADVFQTVKRGRHFYTRCDCCGLNQGTGSARQQQIFNEAQFIDKSAVVIPSGVSMAAKVIEHEPVKPEPAKLEDKRPGNADFNPKEMPADEPVKAPADKKPGFMRFLPGVILLAAAGVGVWMS
jgi:hypothetical protein